jgi:DNA repair protein RecN (Recombination protein N)
MLTHLHIKDFAIIENLEVEFQNGFTILTGETGAGKSILIDALQLALGERADSSLIRQGANRCEITLNFDIKKITLAQKWLVEHDFVSNDECIIRRSITADGRSRSTLNGIACPQQLLRELGSLLVNIHGQHQHQLLLKRDQQTESVDIFAGHLTLRHQVEEIYHAWHEANIQLQTLQTQSAQTRLDFLRYQIQELNNLNLKNNEIAELDQEHKKLANADQLIHHCSNALHLINEYESGSITSLLNNAIKECETNQKLDSKINNALELLKQAAIYIQEANNELQDYSENMESNPKRLQDIENRLQLIHQLARKHQIQANDLIALKQTLEDEFKKLENRDVEIQNIQAKISQLEKEYHEQANKLTLSRQKAAASLEKQVTTKIKTLGMPAGSFVINFETLSSPHAYGMERLEFLVNTNPGQTSQAISKIASGGELSRIGLAIQVITAQKEATPTLIFDEVDTGIGGSTAEIVGNLLRNLGSNAQVLCITHLAQVAAQGHHHLYVKKQVSQDKIQPDIEYLDHEARVNEIARMIGGVKITQHTLAHASEMLRPVYNKSQRLHTP